MNDKTDMREAFNREERYTVIKHKDLKYESAVHALHHELKRREIPTRQCVVVEAHWPIYEQTWDAVQRLAEGRLQAIDEMRQPQQAQGNNTKPIADAVKHLNDWLSMDLCECEGPGHSCGATQIRNTIEGLEKLLSAPPAPAAVPEFVLAKVASDLWNTGYSSESDFIQALTDAFRSRVNTPAEPDSEE